MWQAKAMKVCPLMLTDFTSYAPWDWRDCSLTKWQFEDTELNFCLTSHGTVSCYLRGLDELDVISFVDDSFCWVGTSIMMACYARYSSSFITKNLRCAAPSFGNFWNTTNCCPLIIVYHCTAVSISKYKYFLQSHKEIWRYSFELA